MEKVVVVTDVFLPDITGVGEVISAIYPKLVSHDLEVNLICQSTKMGDWSDDSLGLPVIRYRSYEIVKGRVFLPYLAEVKRVLKLIQNIRPTQIHYHSRSSLINLIIFIGLNLQGFRTKTIYVEHLAGFTRDQSFLLTLLSNLWFLILRLTLINHSYRIIAVSNSVKQFLVDELRVNNDRVVQIDNPLILLNGLQSNRSYTDADIKILFVGRLVSAKNPLMVIKAFSYALRQIKSTGKMVELIVAGDGPLKESVVKTIQDLGLSKEIRYLGKLSPNEVEATMLTTKLVIIPSSVEGSSLTAMKAIALGNVVIATALGPLREIVSCPRVLVELENLNETSLGNKMVDVCIHLNKIRMEFDKLKVNVCNKFAQQTVVEHYRKFIQSTEL